MDLFDMQASIPPLPTCFPPYRLANPIAAIIISVTAVLFFGEIIPQSICTRYGLAIGARLSVFVRVLMFICSPIAWPVGKLLDILLGSDHHSMFRRNQV